MENAIFVTLAKIDHIVYKTDAYSTILNENLDKEFIEHKNCRLGKWYFQGQGKERFGCKKAYSLIDEPHEIVHSIVHKNLDILKYDGGFHINELEPITENFKEMERASETLFSLLNELVNDKFDCVTNS